MRTPHTRTSGMGSQALRSPIPFVAVLLAAALAAGGLLRPALAAPSDGPAAADNAEREAAVARQLRSQEAQILVGKGRKLLAAGAYAEARDALTRAVRLTPGDAVARKLLANAQSALGTGEGDDLLGRVKERQAFKAKALVLQLQMGLFDAESALKKKDYKVAAERAERVLAGVGYVHDAERAAEMRATAEKVLAEARAATAAAGAEQRQAQLARAQHDAAGHRQKRAEAEEIGLLTLRDKAQKQLDARNYDEAEALAGEMLRIAPQSRDALAIRDKARRARLLPGTLRGKSDARREAEKDLMVQIEEELTPLKPGVVLAADTKRRTARAPQAEPIERWQADLHARLSAPVTIEFRETPLREAVNQLGSVGGINIIIDPDTEIKATTVTVPKATMPLDCLLRWVGRFGGLRYCLRDGAVFLTGRQGMLDGPVHRSYDVASLLTPPSGSRPLNVPGAIEPGPRPTEAVEPAQLDPGPIGRGWVEFIRTTVAPQTWAGAGNDRVLQEAQPFTIQYRNGRIVVVHTPEVQQEVEELLNNFRKARNLQVHILARFIEVDKRYLDTLSLNYQYGTGQRYENASATSSMSPATELAPMPRFDDYAPSGGLSLRYARLDDDSCIALLRAAIHEGRGTVLQAPRLTCFNTQRANIQIVRNRNYVRRVSNDFVPEIGNIPSGIIFDVQPFVSADRRYITVILQPQMRSLVSMTDFFYGTQIVQITDDTYAIVPMRLQLPTTELRSVGTTVTVPNGGTILMGGFTEAEEHSAVSTMPFVEGIPLLRYILRGWDRREAARSLIMLVTAQTVDDIFTEE